MGVHPLQTAVRASDTPDTILSPIVRSTPFSKNVINIASSLQYTINSNKRQKMSVHQTYVLAHQARNKLSIEASRPAHNLRLLVGHANMLDSLMLELADAEREQERWFHETVSRANKASQEQPAKTSTTPTSQHIQWADTIIEDEDTSMDPDSSDSDYDEDVDEEVSVARATPFKRATSAPAEVVITTTEIALDEEELDSDEDHFEDEDEDDGELALVRVPSHTNQPPELLHEDSDENSDSEDESMPPSPEQPVFGISEKQTKANKKPSQPIDAASPLPPSPSEQASFFDEGYYLPQRSSGAVIRAF